MITHYALLPPDPTTQAHLVVITKASEGLLTLSVAGQSVEVVGAQIPSRSEYIYHFRVSGLRPGRLHSWSISGVGDGLPLRTLPGAMPPSGLTGVILSDIHTGGSGMGSPGDMDVVGAQAPDFALLAGDHANAFRENYSANNGAFWITMAQDYLSRLSTTFLAPIFAVPGNHDVGNHQWDGTGSVNPDGTYFRTFFPNGADMAPTGANHAAPLLGDWMQVLGVDTHSATVATTAEWAPGAHNDTVPVCLPIQHSPTVSANIRGSNDPALQAALRDALYRLFIEADNILFGVAGHVHARTRSKPLGIVEDDPGGSDNFELSAGGFVVAQESGGYIEAGQGWQNNRNNADTQPWFLDYAARGEPSFQRIDISQGSFRFRTIRDNGATVLDQTWERPKSRRVQAVKADGSLSTAVRADGSPSYPRRVA